MASKIVRTPTRAEGGITPEEKTRMDMLVREWTAIAMRTDPIEPDKIVPAVHALYAAAGLKKPRVVIVPSPLVMAFAYGASAWIWHCRKSLATTAATDAATTAATRIATYDATRIATYDATYAATDAATTSATNAATHIATRDATIDATDAATRDATYAATTAATHIATYAATTAATDAATRDATYAATDAATYDATRIATASATRIATYDATDAATTAATTAATYDATDAATDVATTAATRDATDAATRDATYAATTAATDAATRDATYAATTAATYDATHIATYDATDAATYDATTVATRDATYDATRIATTAATRDATDVATRDATDVATTAATTVATASATRIATASATRIATYDATRDATYDATRDATRDATYDATDAAILEKSAADACRILASAEGIQCAGNWWRVYQGGNMWAAWPCYLAAARDILGLQLPQHSAYQAWEDCAKHGGFRVMHQEFCIVSDFPAEIHKDEQNRPHNENGPSHLWRDGWSLYHWHGVKVPGEWITEKSLTASEAIHWPNVEQRRAACEIIGWAKILDELGAQIVDSDEDPEIGTLLQTNIPDSGVERFLSVMCGTGRRFVIPVPRHLSTAIDANAWTYGLDSMSFKPEIRT